MINSVGHFPSREAHVLLWILQEVDVFLDAMFHCILLSYIDSTVEQIFFDLCVEVIEYYLHVIRGE